MHVKWVGPNSPAVVFSGSNTREFPTKRELLQMLSELQEFVKYYETDFEEMRLDWVDDAGDQWI